MTETGNLVVFCGPSGVGKGTVMALIRRDHPEIHFSISCTTRGPRPGEVEGVHYHFISEEAFAKMVAEDAFLEHACYVGNHYGTPLGPVRQALDDGRDVILEIDVQGALAVKERMKDAVMVFMVPPSFQELERRLRGRGTETEEKIAGRLKKAKGELALADRFDYIVLNTRPENAEEELLAIMKARRCTMEKRGYLLTR